MNDRYEDPVWRNWILTQAAKKLNEEAVKIDEGITQEQLRIKHGLQCPECFGVEVMKRAQEQGFSCCECGCQWGSRV